MRQRGYLIAFVLVLLIACVGGFVGGRFLIRRLQQDFGSQATWAPPTVACAVPDGRRHAGGRGDRAPDGEPVAQHAAGPRHADSHPHPGDSAGAGRRRDAGLRRGIPGAGADTDRD